MGPCKYKGMVYRIVQSQNIIVEEVLQFPLEVEEQAILQSLVEVYVAFRATKENCLDRNETVFDHC